MRAGPVRHVLAVIAALLVAAVLTSAAGDRPEIFPLSQIKPGMKGYARTIFAGDQVETMDLEVIGVLPNLLGPKQHIIMVRLTGHMVEFTGVAAGMSGSPVYIEGKLAGAISLSLNIFAKEAIAGVTPIEIIFDAQDAAASSPATQRAASVPSETDLLAAGATPELKFPVPPDLAARARLGSGVYLTPIETPLVFTGLQPGVLERFREQLGGFGLAATHGGTAEARPDDANIAAGDMVGVRLIQGDLSIQAFCTVTAVTKDAVFICGHPLFGFGDVDWPMVRGRVLTTLASSMASFKLANAGGVIGTISQDRRTSVVGRLGPGPRLIPVELTLKTPAQEKSFRFEVIEHAKLTPLLVAIAAFNGLIATPAYSEGMTYRLSGGIEVTGHTMVSLENMFAPTDMMTPDGLFVAFAVQSVFLRIFNNPYERARVERISLRVESVPERRAAAIENAWSEKSEVAPGESINVKVLLRPYRGAPVIREVPITIPAQVARGPLRIVVSDSEALNRMTRFFSFSPQARLAGLEQLITLINRERRNNRLYVSLLQPTPTLLLEDKEMPNAPMSQINVLDQRRTQGSSLLLRESMAGEWSVPMNQVITGQYSLIITVK